LVVFIHLYLIVQITVIKGISLLTIILVLMLQRNCFV